MIHLDQTWPLPLVERPTAPRPVLRMVHQSSRNRVSMFVFQLLLHFLRASYIEIVETFLSKSRQLVLRERQLQLPRRLLSPSSPAELARNALLHRLQYSRRSAHRRLAHQQVNVVRHHHISDDGESVPLPHLAENPHDQVSRLCAPQKRQPPITTEGDEMQVAPAVVSF